MDETRAECALVSQWTTDLKKEEKRRADLKKEEKRGALKGDFNECGFLRVEEKKGLQRSFRAGKRKA